MNNRREKDNKSIEKALLDEKSRLEDAEILGMLTVVKSLLENGMPLDEVAKHTPYESDKLSILLKRYHFIQ
jgi:hypothetical protein